MSEAIPTESPAPDAGPTPRRKGPPAWGVVLFLALLGGWLIVNQFASTSGPPIEWIENDLDAALKKAAATKRHVFLYLYEPTDPVHQRNEREVFNQHWARSSLTKVVCCRVALRPGDLLRLKYEYHDTPLFLLLDAKGNRLGGVEGAVDRREFLTHIGTPASR